MSLPNINVIPKYSLTLPSGRQINYRPFLVKEEMIILTANELGSDKDFLDAIKQIVSNCTYGEVDVETTPIFDVEYLMAHIRIKSKGENVGMRALCQHCQEWNDVAFNLSDIKVETNPNHSKKIMLTDDVGIMMRYPTYRMVMEHSGTVSGFYDMMTACIECIFRGEELFDSKDIEKEEMKKFVMDMTLEQHQKIKDFFETSPKINSNIKFVCKKCKESNSMEVNGIHSFFE